MIEVGSIGGRDGRPVRLVWGERMPAPDAVLFEARPGDTAYEATVDASARLVVELLADPSRGVHAISGKGVRAGSGLPQDGIWVAVPDRFSGGATPSPLAVAEDVLVGLAVAAREAPGPFLASLLTGTGTSATDPHLAAGVAIALASADDLPFETIWLGSAWDEPLPDLECPYVAGDEPAPRATPAVRLARPLRLDIVPVDCPELRAPGLHAWHARWRPAV